MSRSLLGVGVAAVCLSLGTGCSAGEETRSAPGVPVDDCGVPTSTRAIDSRALPAVFSLGGRGEVTRLVTRDDGYSAVVAVPLGVEDAYLRYRKALLARGFAVVGEDYEGFEAELYLRHRRGNAAVQLRKTTCEDTIVAYVRFVRSAR